MPESLLKGKYSNVFKETPLFLILHICTALIGGIDVQDFQFGRLVILVIGSTTGFDLALNF